MHDTIEVLLTRRSIRRFEDSAIDLEHLETILRAGLYAPSGRNSQNTIMVVVQDPEEIRALEQLNARELTTPADHPFFGAPILIVVLGDPNHKTWIDDGALVMGNLMNAAHALGLGSCWINRAREVFDKPEGKAWLAKWGIPEHYRGVANCIIGVPSDPAVQAYERKGGRIIYSTPNE